MVYWLGLPEPVRPFEDRRFHDGPTRPWHRDSPTLPDRGPYLRHSIKRIIGPPREQVVFQYHEGRLQSVTEGDRVYNFTWNGNGTLALMTLLVQNFNYSFSYQPDGTFDSVTGADAE